MGRVVFLGIYFEIKGLDFERWGMTWLLDRLYGRIRVRGSSSRGLFRRLFGVLVFFLG